MDGLLQKDTKPFSSIEPLRCPVCLKYSFGLKIFICRKGHSVCENCQPDLDECPTCRGRPPQTRNFGLEEMAEGVVAPCPYAEKGCTQSVVGSEYKLHKSICDFGPITCSNTSETVVCPKFNNYLAYTAHLKSQHFIKELPFSLEKPIRFSLSYTEIYNLESTFVTKMLCSQGVQFLFNGFLYWKTGDISLWISYMGSEKDARGYAYTIEMRNPSKTRGEVKWTVPVHPARNTLLKLKDEMGYEFVCIPFDLFRKYCLVGNEYAFIITIARVKPPQKSSIAKEASTLNAGQAQAN